MAAPIPAAAGRGPAGATQASRAALALLAIAWCTFVLALYYTRLWTLLAGGPEAWSVPDLGQDLRHTGLPHAAQAAARALGGAGAALIVLLATAGFGRLLDPLLMPPGLTPFESWIVRLANGAGAFGLVLLALAFAGLYRPSVVRALSLAGAAGGTLALLGTRRLAGRSLSESTDKTSPWTWIAALAAGLAFVTALAPETAHDALWYHLELPRRWLAAGRPVDDVHEYVALYPLGWDLLFGAALAFDGSVGARLLHWSTLIAGGGIAAGIARRAFGGQTGPMAAAIFMTAPTVLWEATSAYVDLALAVHCAIGAAALAQSMRDPDRRWLALGGVNFGIACATKHLGLAIACLTFAICGAAVILETFGRTAPQRRPLTRRRLAGLTLAGVLTLAIPLPWYVRAWAASGNPVFPEMHAVFGARPPERWDALTEDELERFEDRFGSAATGATSMPLPWDMIMHGASYGGALGPVFLLMLPGGAFVAWRGRGGQWIAVWAAAYLVLWASPLSSLQLRFLVPWWLVVSPLAAAGLVATFESWRGLRPAAGTIGYGALAAVLLLNLPPFTPLHERDRAGWDGWLTHVIHRLPVETVLGGWSDDEWLRAEVRSYPAWHHLNAHAPPHARVLTFFSGDHFYSARARLWSESVAARPVTWGATEIDADTLVARLRAMGITHVIAPRRHPHRTAGHDRLAILRPDVTERFHAVHEDYWAVVYRVDGSAPADAAAGASDAARTDQR